MEIDVETLYPLIEILGLVAIVFLSIKYGKARRKLKELDVLLHEVLDATEDEELTLDEVHRIVDAFQVILRG